MAALARPVRVGKGLEEARELIVLRDDRVQEISDSKSAKTGASS